MELKEEELLWIHKSPPDSQWLQKRILGKAVEVGIKVLFSSFSYTFGGKFYLQLEGAPIGTRVACACANLVMEWLWEKVAQMMLDTDPRTNIKLHMKGNFVDDARILMNTLRKGSKYSNQKFVWSEEHERKDLDDGMTREDITYREMGACLNR